MSGTGHPGISWYCAECGYKRIWDKNHTCPPDAQEVIKKLLDIFPRNTPNDQIREEIEALSVLLREHRPDALQVKANVLQWLLSTFSFFDIAAQELKPHKDIIDAIKEADKL